MLSVGWPRYGYLGLVAGLTLVGLAVAEGAAELEDRVERRAPGRGRLVAPAMVAALAALAVVGNVPRQLDRSDRGEAVAMAAFVEQHVAREAVVETWEWPLNSLGRHVNYHYPGQHHVNQAIYQRSRGEPFAFDYDLMSANPQYLITGPFSDLTGIYDPVEVARHFDPMTTVGPYVLHRRRDGR